MPLAGALLVVALILAALAFVPPSPQTGALPKPTVSVTAVTPIGGPIVGTPVTPFHSTWRIYYLPFVGKD